MLHKFPRHTHHPVRSVNLTPLFSFYWKFIRLWTSAQSTKIGFLTFFLQWEFVCHPGKKVKFYTKFDSPEKKKTVVADDAQDNDDDDNYDNKDDYGDADVDDSKAGDDGYANVQIY